MIVAVGQNMVGRRIGNRVEELASAFFVILLVFGVCGLMFSCSKISAQSYSPSPCANGRCPIPARESGPGVGVIGEPARSGWYVVEGRPPGEYTLYVNGVSVGSYNEDTGEYLSSEGRRWMFKNACNKAVNPALLEQIKPVVFEQIPVNGIDPLKLQPHEGDREKFRSNVGEISKADAVKLLGAPSLRDDSGLLRVTVIGAESERIKVLNDLKNDSALAMFASEILVKDYAPDHWAVANNGFVSSGKPTIYIQSGKGRVLHRQDDYDGAKALSGAIRKAKNYDPAKDADLRKEPVIVPASPVVPVVPVAPVVPAIEPTKPTDTPLTPAPPNPVAVPPWLAIIAVIVAFIFGSRKAAK